MKLINSYIKKFYSKGVKQADIITRHRLAKLVLRDSKIQSIHMTSSETTYEQAKRFADSDTCFVRVYELLPQLSEQQRFEFAKKEIQKIDGITDSCTFASYKYQKYQFENSDYIAEITKELHKKVRVTHQRLLNNKITPPKK